MEGQHGAGKGDSYRKLDREAWDRGWAAIWGKGGKALSKRKPRARKTNRKRNP
jgi:hypothetical protein